VSERVRGTLFRYVVQPCVVEVEVLVARSGTEAQLVELQISIGGDWHETIAIDASAFEKAVVKA
jgi:hypothetical protein